MELDNDLKLNGFNDVRIVFHFIWSPIIGDVTWILRLLSSYISRTIGQGILISKTKNAIITTWNQVSMLRWGMVGAGADSWTCDS